MPITHGGCCYLSTITTSYHRWNLREYHNHKKLIHVDLTACVRHTCRQSPLNTTTFPANGSLLLHKKRNVWSTQSTTCLCCIGSSSQMMSSHASTRAAVAFSPWAMLHRDVEFILRGTLNLECTVRPPSRRSAAIPLAATGSAINPLARALASIALLTNVFPVPAAASIKNIADSVPKHHNHSRASYKDSQREILRRAADRFFREKHSMWSISRATVGHCTYLLPYVELACPMHSK